jgi:hypothetical protein
MSCPKIGLHKSVKKWKDILGQDKQKQNYNPKKVVVFCCKKVYFSTHVLMFIFWAIKLWARTRRGGCK